MKCTNKRCGIDIKAPLELYNGELACPKCREKVVLMLDEVKVTPENNELFRLSELWFSYGLSKDVNISVPDSVAKIKSSPASMIKKATVIANEASLLGHPEARWRMGFYYDKDFVENDKTESARCKIAAKYYESIFKSPVAEFQGYGISETRDLKRRAAEDFINMILALPKQEQTYYESALQKAKAIAPDKFDSDVVAGAEKSDTEIFEDVIKKLTSKVRAPLFGVVTVSNVSVDGIIKIFKDNLKTIRTGVNFQFVPISGDGTMHPGFVTSPFFPESVDGIAKGAKALGESAGYEEISIFFFNSLGAHKYLKGKKMAELSKYAVSDKSLDTLQILVKECSASRVALFYDDDVALFDAKKPVKAYDTLVESLTEKAN